MGERLAAKSERRPAHCHEDDAMSGTMNRESCSGA